MCHPVPIFELFLSVGNLKKFFKLKLKPKLFRLNLAARSSTGLNLFGLGHKRRSSVAVRATDDAALTVGGMRPAKSSANILQQLGSPSPSKKKQQGAAAAGHTVCLSQG